MKCPSCGFDKSMVIDSRPDDTSIRRRRECSQCRYRFTTYETVEILPLLVVKKDGSRQVFDRGKIMAGLIKSTYKRPVTPEQLEKLVQSIESELLNSLRSEISSEEIGIMVMDRLQQLDEVSYVRFASVYREFKDIDTFLQAIHQLQKGKNSPSD